MKKRPKPPINVLIGYYKNGGKNHPHPIYAQVQAHSREVSPETPTNLGVKVKELRQYLESRGCEFVKVPPKTSSETTTGLKEVFPSERELYNAAWNRRKNKELRRKNKNKRRRR